MSGDYDSSLDQPLDDVSFCSIHGFYWDCGEEGCEACEEEAADRTYDTKKEREP